MEKVDTETLRVKPHKMTVDQKMKDLFHHFPKPDHSKPHIVTLDKPWLYRVWDINQKFLFLKNNMLVAAPKDGNSPDYLVAITPNTANHENKFPIFLGTQDGAQTLSCGESGGQPQLTLEGKAIMDLYNDGKEHKNFTFFCIIGSSTETGSFESAAFPGWFLSTSPEPNQPIRLSRQGGTEITQFYFEKVKGDQEEREEMGEAEMMKPHKTVQQEMNDLFNHFKKLPPGTVVIHKLPGPWYFKIWDINQKYLLLVGDRLLSAPRNSNSPEGLIAVIPNQAIGKKDDRTFAIFMGNEDGERTLSCVEVGGQPQIKLAGEKIMDLYNNKKEESKNFSFLCKTGSGKETGSFESVAFPGWFLSTSPEPNKPIGLSQQGGAEITEFFMEKTNKGA
ncbi:uncharacterized protein LOC117060294 [Lacerta agilis]|uniref:uncharacterized protein LOC117060294 n=1 Tax=Lacerta agilis TaxID=80427 RepID=UPI00141A19EC|nr:uncharacterized protein LOC117060294 [Lacerta agilis]